MNCRRIGPRADGDVSKPPRLHASSRSGRGTRRSPGPGSSCSRTALSGRRGATHGSDRIGASSSLLALASIPLWLVFEGYNLVIRNWYLRAACPKISRLRMFGYAWSFATIWPAIFEGAELVAVLRAEGLDGQEGAPAARPEPRTSESEARHQRKLALGGLPRAAAARGPGGPQRHWKNSRAGWAGRVVVAAGALMLITPFLVPSDGRALHGRARVAWLHLPPRSAECPARW